MRTTLDQITLADLLQSEGRIAELLRVPPGGDGARSRRCRSISLD